MSRRGVMTFLLSGLLSPAGCSAPGQAPTGSTDPPVAAGSMGPNLASDGDAVLLSWLEPEGEGHALRVSRLDDDGWAPARTVVTGSAFFANWADFPSVDRGSDGALVAHWLEKSGSGTYAYDVQLARSTDDGRTWSRLGPAHDDGVETEHGFVSMVPETGGVRAFWLDGREMEHDGPMTLRTAPVGQSVGPDEVLDERVCECCQTSAAVTSDGPLVVYRDRSEEEIRDIFIVRRTADGWSEPAPVHVDGWRVPGCPVNGPAVAADGRRVAVAWFTAADERPRVLVAFSEDSGATFGAPVPIDDAEPLGRVDLAMARDGDAVVVWLAAGKGDAAEIKARRVSANGGLGEPIAVTETGRARGSGFPRVALHGGDLVAAWTEPGESPRVRSKRLPMGTIPAVSSAAGPRAGTEPVAGLRAWDRTPGSAAPDYVARALDDRPVPLSSMRGRAVLLNFWATWCLPCREEVPDLAALQRRHEASGLMVVGISLDEADKAAEVRRFVETERIPYTILLDPEDRATGLFGLTMLPATFLFDRSGVLVWSRHGLVTAGDPALLGAITTALEAPPAGVGADIRGEGPGSATRSDRDRTPDASD